MEWILGIIGGLIGGNAAGTKNNLGATTNSIAGAFGGGLGGSLLGGGGGLDIPQIAGAVGRGGVTGAVVTAIVGSVMKGRGAK